MEEKEKNQKSGDGSGAKEPSPVIFIVMVIAVLLCAGLAIMVIRKKSQTAEPAIKKEEAEQWVAGLLEKDTPATEAAAVAADNGEGDPEADGAGSDGNETGEEIPEETEAYMEEGVHTYELIVADVTWTEAYEQCLRMGGHLVRINSPEEFDAIISQIENEGKENIKFWLGGAAEDRRYHWVYGEEYALGDVVLNEDPVCVSYWLEGEPSFLDETTDTEENRMNMFYMKDLQRWVWNDVPDDILAVASFYQGTIGYICEYE